MRIVPALALVAACGTSTPTEPMPGPLAPTPTPAPAPFDGSQACDGNGPHNDSGVERIERASGPDLGVIQCEFYAYQGDYEVWLLREDGPASKALSTTGIGAYHPESDTYTNFAKARGPGDCGTFTRYAIAADALTVSEERSRECTDEAPDEIDPASWPLVGASDADTPCAGRTAYFACPVRGGKWVELCGKADGSELQYRFGPLGAPELTLPSTPDTSAFGMGEQSWIRGQAIYVAIENEGHRYTLVEKLEGGSMSGPPPDNFIGVRVDRNGEQLTRLECTGDDSNWYFAMDQLLSAGLKHVGYLE